MPKSVTSIVSSASAPKSASLGSHQPSDVELSLLSEQLGTELSAKGQSCVTAESCTGGWVAKLLTDVAGSSAWFVGGFVCYSNVSKQSMLTVPETLIVKHGAVSREVVLALVDGALERTEADIAVAISGVAGPAGGTAEKPVGTVWIASRTRGQPEKATLFQFCGARDDVRRAAVGQALHAILSLTQ